MKQKYKYESYYYGIYSMKEYIKYFEEKLYEAAKIPKDFFIIDYDGKV